MSALPLTGLAALSDLRVVELQSEAGAFAGKLLADMGADVVTVEPPGGASTRNIPPFLDDEPHPERSLHFWHYNLNKRAITLDWTTPAGRDLLLRLLDGADALIEAEGPGVLASHGLHDDTLRAGRPGLIHVSMSAFGRDGPRAGEEATDLTLLAGGGPAWSCGYDDHTLPPIAGGGYQGYQTACHFAVMGLLTAVLHRDAGGPGQRIDVNMHAASNVTTEGASTVWNVAGETVQRQTGRHAAVLPTQATMTQCADGRWVNTGMPPRSGAQFQSVLDWLDELGLRAGFAEAALLEEATSLGKLSFAEIREDDLLRAMFYAGRDAILRIAGRARGLCVLPRRPRTRLPVRDHLLTGGDHGRPPHRSARLPRRGRAPGGGSPDPLPGRAVPLQRHPLGRTPASPADRRGQHGCLRRTGTQRRRDRSAASRRNHRMSLFQLTPVSEGGERFAELCRETRPAIAARAAEADQQGRFVAGSIADLRRAGVLAASVPVEFGGLGVRSLHEEQLRILMALVTMQARAVAMAKAGELENVRHCTRRVA